MRLPTPIKDLFVILGPQTAVTLAPRVVAAARDAIKLVHHLEEWACRFAAEFTVGPCLRQRDSVNGWIHKVRLHP